MPLLLDQREPGLQEEMDRRDCDPELLRRTYRQFATLNRLISRWNRIYRREIRPLLAGDPGRAWRLLDIGFGGGDIPARLATLARAEGRRLEVTAIDTDPRALQYATSRDYPPASGSSRGRPSGNDSPQNRAGGVRYRLASPADLLEEGEAFDFVISNHLLHHLGADGLLELLHHSERLCRGKVLFCDIERSDLGWMLFGLLSRPLFRRSFITVDGLRSIRRSFTRKELREAVPAGWEVHPIPPCRLLLKKELLS